MDFRRFGVRHGLSEEGLGAILRKSWRRIGRPGSILNLNCLRRVQKPSWRRLWPSLRAKSRAKGHWKATGKPVFSNEREARLNK